MIKILSGHTTVETAYEVDDYPYGFKLRTKIRFWLEKHPKKGYRFCSQTVNPKTGRWNAEKKDTYFALAGVMYLDENGHVDHAGIGSYPNAKDALAFVEKFKEDLNVQADVSLLAKAGLLYESKKLEKIDPDSNEWVKVFENKETWQRVIDTLARVF